MAFSARHPIQVAAARAGLSPDQLRVWERRYRAVEPARSEGGHRLYSDADVERLSLLRAAVDAGRRISEVAPLSTEELTMMVLEDQVAAQEATPPDREAMADPIALLDCMDAIESLDPERLEEILVQQLVTHGTADFIEGLVAPLMDQVGQRWHDGELSVGQEHMATAVLRGVASRILADSTPSRALGTLVMAAPRGQRHEVGLLLAAATASQIGWKVIYLGADLPAEEIVGAARRVEAAGVALSLCYSPEDVDDVQEVRAIVEGLGGIPVLVGGGQAGRLRRKLTSLGAETLGDLRSLRDRLDALRPTG